MASANKVFVQLAALIAAVFLALGPAVTVCHAQTRATLAPPAASASPPQKKPTFLQWAKKNHLNYYLAGYAIAVSLFAGVAIAGLSYRYSERGKPYSLAKARTTMWAAALGLGAGVAVAVLQVPSAQQGKSRSLAISLIAAALVTPAVARVSFIGCRSLHIRRAGNRGRRESDRMDLL